MDEKDVIDQEHLRLLTLFYYISGGVTCLFSLIPVIHVCMGIFFVFLSHATQSANNPPPAFIGWIFIIIGSIIILAGFTLGSLKICAGLCIKKRKHYAFCLAVSFLICLFIPFGTLLGVSSVIVLMRESVKKQFLSVNSVSS